MERDGLVAQSGLRRGAGKPSYTYALTSDAETLFPKAFGELLHLLLDVLSERMPPEEMDGLMRDVGHRLAGGMAHVEERANGFAIVGCGCPIARAVTGNPHACYLAETLLTDLIGAPVRQICDTTTLQCRFEIAAAATGFPAD